MTNTTPAELSRECASCFFLHSSIEFIDGILNLEMACEQHAAAFPNALDCPHCLSLDNADDD
jgi:hypothetical protein